VIAMLIGIPLYMKLFSIFHGKRMEVKVEGSIEMVVFVWLTIYTYMALHFFNTYKPLGFGYETCLQDLTNSNRYTK